MPIFGKKTEQETVGENEQSQSRKENIAPFKLELLITIVEKNKAEFYADLIQSYEVNFQFSALAKGTAKADILNYLGLADTDKAVIFSVVREDKLEGLTYSLEKKFRTLRGGKGVAVSIPLTSMIGTSVYAFLANAQDIIKKG